jgi:hypothetical protein
LDGQHTLAAIQTRQRLGQAGRYNGGGVDAAVGEEEVSGIHVVARAGGQGDGAVGLGSELLQHELKAAVKTRVGEAGALPQGSIGLHSNSFAG